MKCIVGLALASAAAATSHSGHKVATETECCRSLSHHHGSIYHGPSSPEYEGLINSRWSKTSILHPGCVVRPASAQDVSSIVKLLVKGQCEFAVKSGGHNANPGANSIEGGVSIDLGALNSAYLAPDRRSLSLGSGATWGQAYDRFNHSNIGFTGGVCEDVGVGGPTLGGGQSLVQAQKGWVVDNIRSYEIVLASGAIVNVSLNSHPDLFKALKGGGNNFGIVTRVEFVPFEQESIWGGDVLVNLNGKEANRTEMLDRICNATTVFVKNNYLDVDTGLQLSTAYMSHNRGHAAEIIVSNTAGVEYSETAKPFFNLPNQVKTRGGKVKMADFVHIISKLMPRGYREVTSTVTINNDYKTLREIIDATDKLYEQLPHKDEVDWLVQLFPQPKCQQSYSESSGGNSLGLSEVTEDQIVLWFTTRWTDDSLDSMMEGVRDDFVKVSEAVARKHGTLHPFLYMNYAAPSQNPLCGYGAKSVAHLRQTAQKYDPQGVFQKLMPGGFKITKANCDGVKHG